MVWGRYRCLPENHHVLTRYARSSPAEKWFKQESRMMWRVISAHALHFRSWDDEFVVYNSLSGDTHLLGAAAAHVLSELQRTPAEAVTLAGSLAPVLQTSFDEELVLETERLLAELDRLALIERSRF